MADRFGKLGRGKERERLTRHLGRLREERPVPTHTTSRIQHVIYDGSWRRTWEAVFQAIITQEAAADRLRPERAEPLEFLSGEWAYEGHTIEYDKTLGAEPWKVTGHVMADDPTHHETIYGAVAFIRRRVGKDS